MRLAGTAFLLLTLSLSLSNCTRKPKVVQPSGSTSFELGEKYYQAGDYTHAIVAFEAYLSAPDGTNRESALFHLALSHALRAQDLDDLARAQELFEQLAREFPRSSVAQQARLVARNTQLMRDLQQARAREEEQLRTLGATVEQLIQRVAQLEKDQEAQSSDPLWRAAGLVTQGSYKEAADIYESYLASGAQGAKRQQALFQLALIYLTPDTGLKDNRSALALLDKISREAPTSPQASAARYLASVHRELFRLRGQVESQQADLKQLNEELRALKAIDLKRR